MEIEDDSRGILTPSTGTNGAQIPTYDELFRLIRAAGPSNPAKARAIDRVLTGARILITQLYDQLDAKELQQQASSLTRSESEIANPSVNQQIVRVVGQLPAKAPQWVRQDLISVDPAVRLRAEDTLSAMIAASLANQSKP